MAIIGNRRRRVVAFAVAAIAVAGCSAGGPGGHTSPPAALSVPATQATTPEVEPGTGPGRGHHAYGPWGAPVLTDTFTEPRLDPRKWQVYQAPNARSHPGIAAGTHLAHGRLVLDGGLYSGRDESAGIVSRLAQTYGRWEARIRADRGAGYSATAFLWPTRLGYPEYAEIDFAEILDPTRRTGGLFIHHGRDDRQLQRIARIDFTRWHTVAIDWLPSHLTFYVDGRPQWTYHGPFVPHRADMHLYLRNEVMDGFHRTPRTPKRVRMQVDWVRVFRAPSALR